MKKTTDEKVRLPKQSDVIKGIKVVNMGHDITLKAGKLFLCGAPIPRPLADAIRRGAGMVRVGNDRWRVKQHGG